MDQIEDCLSFYLGKAYQRVTQSAKQRLAPYGVTPVQYALLKVLWEHDQQSGAELGERLLLDSATMTGLLDRLEHAGLIERKAHETDRRVNRVALTAHGRDLQVPLDREMDQMNQDFLGEFSSEERKLLRGLLTTLAGWEQGEQGRAAWKAALRLSWTFSQKIVKRGLFLCSLIQKSHWSFETIWLRGKR